jgi:hypothetical protein
MHDVQVNSLLEVAVRILGWIPGIFARFLGFSEDSWDFGEIRGTLRWLNGTLRRLNGTLVWLHGTLVWLNGTLRWLNGICAG